MRLGLLRCDEVGGDRESRFGGYLKLFADLFAKVDTGVDITDYDVAGGVLPADPGDDLAQDTGAVFEGASIGARPGMGAEEFVKNYVQRGGE